MKRPYRNRHNALGADLGQGSGEGFEEMFSKTERRRWERINKKKKEAPNLSAIGIPRWPGFLSALKRLSSIWGN